MPTPPGRRASALSLLGALLLTSGTAGEAPPAVPDVSEIHFVLEWGKKGKRPGEFHFPIGIAINRADEVFVTDHSNNRVQKFDANGKLLATFPVLPNPGGIAVGKGGELYVSHFPAARLGKEKTPDRISVYSPAGKLLRQWGSSGTGDGQLSWPGGLAVSREGRVYVADQTNRRVQVFDAGGKFLAKWGEYGTKPGQFGGNVGPRSRVGGPQFVALDSAGNVYTTEGSVGRVQKFTPDGKFLLAWGDNQDKPGSFGGGFGGFKASLQGPIGICIDKKDRVWVSAVCGRVQQFTRDGKYLRGFGATQGTRPGQFLAPHGLALDSRGNLYVVDAYNHRVQKFAVPR
jgi:DNA-binding beta-propeller fold protein YncE